MIADWSVDVGPESPLIEVPWEGWVDLHWDASDANLPWRADLAQTLSETGAYPELIDLLRAANNRNAVSSKVDVFPVSADEVDPELAELGSAATRFGIGSYLDLLPRCRNFSRFEELETLARRTAAALQTQTLPRAYAEVVIRPAVLHGKSGFGLTLYAMGFGRYAPEARATWAEAAQKLTAAVQLEISSRILDSTQARAGDRASGNGLDTNSLNTGE